MSSDASRKSEVTCLLQDMIVKCGYYPTAHVKTWDPAATGWASLSMRSVQDGNLLVYNFDVENSSDREALRRLSAQLAEIVRDINNTYGERE